MQQTSQAAVPRSNPGDWLIIGVFAVALLVPMADFQLHFIKVKQLDENRAPAPLPTRPTTWAATREFPRKFDAWWADAFGARSLLIRLNAMQKVSLGVSPSDLVVAGSGGWLFFRGDESVEVWRGLRPFTEQELADWARELERRQAWLASQGSAYLFVIGPNKETIYGEQMPRRYTRVGPTRFEQLTAYLKSHSSVQVLDLREALQAGKARQQLYFSTDTHWNDFGMFVGYQELLQALAKVDPSVRPRTFDMFTPREAPRWYGDLVQMLGMNGLLDERRVELVPNQPYAARLAQGATPYAHQFEGPPGRGRAVVFHDSYFLPPEERGDPARAATAARLNGQSAFRMLPLLAEQFSESTFVWSASFDPELIKRVRPTVVINEQVERGLRNPVQARAPDVEATGRQ